MKSEWVWMPHAGHYILANYCRFHLNTWVRGFIISTVGEYWPDSDVRRITAKSKVKFYPEKKIDMTLKGDAFDDEYMRVFGFHDLGWNHKYETMVFKALPNDPSKIMCCPFYADGDVLDSDGYNDPNSATKGHYALCEKYDQINFVDEVK